MVNEVVKNSQEEINKVRLPDLSPVKEDLTKLQTNINTINLQESITNKTILKYIEWSFMETELKKLQASWEIKDFTIEKFASDISTTVEKYLKQSFKKLWTNEKPWEETLTIPNGVVSSISLGIQFSMMETLTKSWAQGADFFSKFSKTDTKTASSTFSGLTEAFNSGGISKLIGGVGQTNEFFTLAKKVENCVGYVSRYCGEGKELGDGSKVQKLANANEFRKLLANPIWADDALYSSKTPKDLWLTISDQTIPTMSTKDIDELKKIANNKNIPINKKSIEAIMNSLPTAQKFLENRSWYQNQAIDLMGTVSWLLDGNFFGLWSVWSILWISNPLELFGKTAEERKKWWVINFVLKIMWFNNGMEWLYEQFLTQSIAKNMTPEGKSFIATSLKSYKDLIAAWAYTGITTVNTLGLTTLDPLLQAKIPSEFDFMKKALYDNINTKKASLNIWVLQSLWIQVPTKEDADKNIIIDKDKINDLVITEDDMTKYLQVTIPTLVDNKDFMVGIKSSDDFMLALTGGLVCGTCFAWWVALGIEPVSRYIDVTTKTPETTSNGSIDVINGQVDFSKWGFTDIQKKNINHLIDEMKKKNITNPYTQIGILSCISKESGFTPVSEFSYGTTPNANIREIFGARVSSYSESELEALKKDDQKFFDAVYGQQATAKLWWNTGNTEVGDGYKYRGRGFNQITFKSSYKTYGDLIWEDLVGNPDLLNTPEIAAKAALEFFRIGNKWEDLSTLAFMDKETAMKKFTDINAWGHANNYTTALLASKNFDVKLAA